MLKIFCLFALVLSGNFSLAYGQKNIDVEGTKRQIQNLFDRFLQRDQLPLTNGTKLDLPVHYFQIEGLISMGMLDLKAARDLMADSGLYPLPISSEHALAAVYLVNHPSNSIGAYQEFVVLIASTNKSERSLPNLANIFWTQKRILDSVLFTEGDRNARVSNELLYYVPWISVSSEQALLAGREIWNLPKSLASFDLSLSGSSKSAAVKGVDCQLRMEVSRKSWNIEMPLYMDLNLVGQWKKSKQILTLAPMLGKGRMHVALFDSKKGDVFIADENSPCGEWLAKAKYKPLFWESVSRSGSVLFSPHYLTIDPSQMKKGEKNEN